MKRYTYTVKIHRADPDEAGYWAEVPALPGCFTQGETIDHCLEMAQDAISGYLQSLIKHGEPIPEEEPAREGDVTAMVSVEASAAA